jgi:branched-chain amino acid aminotransferase
MRYSASIPVEPLIFLNDRLVPLSEAKVSVLDYGFLYGDGVYETLRAYSGVFFKRAEHLDRLFQSAGLLHMHLPFDRDFLSRALQETLKANNLLDATARLTVSRGVGETLSFHPSTTGPPRPTLVILPKPFAEYPLEWYTRGVTAVIVKTRRNLPQALNPQIKSLNFLNNLLARMEARSVGAQEGILLNSSGYLTEGATSNIFLLKGNTLSTPSLAAGLLPGITRKVLLDLASGIGLQTEETWLTPQDLESAGEAFLTGTTIEVLPLTRLGEKPIGPGHPGPITRALHQAFRSAVEAAVQEAHLVL